MLQIAGRAAEKLRAMTFRHREYAIGVMTGPSPLALSAPARTNPVLTKRSVTDVQAAFVADPFLFRGDGEWFMFFEVLAVRPGSRQGEIAWARSRDGLRWRYGGICLQEPFHLSYPHVFRDGSEIYLVPETAKARSIRLYRAESFPTRWTYVTTLLTGRVLVDSSIFRHDGRWWMYTQTALESRHDTLRLFHADDVRGPWTEHPRSPVVEGDARIARPAGRVLTLPDGRILRFSQDCRGCYGRSVHAREVKLLTTTEYAEAECVDNPLLMGSGRGWNRNGMHHVDAHLREDGTWLAAVDGWADRIWKP